MLGLSGIWLVATGSDLINSTVVFLVGTRIKKNKKTKKYLKWRDI